MFRINVEFIRLTTEQHRIFRCTYFATNKINSSVIDSLCVWLYYSIITSQLLDKFPMGNHKRVVVIFYFCFIFISQAIFCESVCDGYRRRRQPFQHYQSPSRRRRIVRMHRDQSSWSSIAFIQIASLR